MLIDAVQSIARFVKITEARQHDRIFLKALQLLTHSMVVFDLACIVYVQFDRRAAGIIHFATPQRENAVKQVAEVVQQRVLPKGPLPEERKRINATKADIHVGAASTNTSTVPLKH
jgi:hypothetical protein